MPLSKQLKKLYRDIFTLKTKILSNSCEPQDDSHIIIKGGPCSSAEEVEKSLWKAIDEHKQ
jgi:hypothetical protein